MSIEGKVVSCSHKNGYEKSVYSSLISIIYLPTPVKTKPLRIQKS